jgi:hypothetical protein
MNEDNKKCTLPQGAYWHTCSNYQATEFSNGKPIGRCKYYKSGSVCLLKNRCKNIIPEELFEI